MKVSGNKFSHVFSGRVAIENHVGKFRLKKFNKKFGDNYEITLYAIHGFGPVTLSQREKSTFHIYSNDEDGEAGYQILGFKDGKKPLDKK